MLDRLPYELVRRILDEAHPPFAASSSDSPSTTASRTRLRFLGGVERTCKNVQAAAHDLLWHTVWIGPGAASVVQLDRILAQGSGEGDLVRVLNYERFEKLKNDEQEACVGLEVVTSAVGKMHKLVEISLRQNVKGGVVDFAELLKLQCLRSLILEGDDLELSHVDDQSFHAVVLPKMHHLVLKGVSFSSGIVNNLLTGRRFPALQTVNLQRIMVYNKLVFPDIEADLLQRLETINVALDEHALYQPALCERAERVLAHVDRRIVRSVFADLKKTASDKAAATLYPAAKLLVLSSEELEVENNVRGEHVAATVRLALVLTQARLVSTMFRPRSLRTNEAPGAGSVGLAKLQRTKAAEQAWSLLDKECVDKGVDVFYLDVEGDEGVERWPTWAQADPSLRNMVATTLERDRRRAVVHEAWRRNDPIQQMIDAVCHRKIV